MDEAIWCERQLAEAHENDYSQLPLFLNLTFNEVGFIFHVYLP